MALRIDEPDKDTYNSYIGQPGLSQYQSLATRLLLHDDTRKSVRKKQYFWILSNCLSDTHRALLFDNLQQYISLDGDDW